MLTLTVLGCDGSHVGSGGGPRPAPEGSGCGVASGYLVRWWPTGSALWLDAGPGTFATLQRFVDPRTLSAVVLSHRHPDHCSDIDGFITAARWVWGWDRPPLPVFAAAGVAAQQQRSDDQGIVQWHQVGEGDRARVGPMELTFSITDHGPPTVAVGLAVEGRTLGYSADTGPGWSMAALGRPLDLALCEATYTQPYEGTGDHMSGRQAGRSARAAQARRLVTTHRWPSMDPAAVLAEAREAFGGPVVAATVGRGFSL